MRVIINLKGIADIQGGVMFPDCFPTRGPVVAGLLVSLLTSCTSTSPPVRSEISPAPTAPLTKVVATNSVLCDLTKQIAADSVELTCLIPDGTDVHVYQPTPENRRAIEDANLIFYSGYNFEPTLTKLIQASSNPATKIAVDERAVPKPLQGEHGHDHDQPGHDHEAEEEQVADPHVFHNAAYGASMAEVIRDQLITLQPDNNSLYQENTKKLTTELAKIHTWIKAQIATIPPANRKLVTTHEAFGYYSQAYGIPLQGALQGISTEEQPTAARVAELTQEIKASGVPTIFIEATVNPKLIDTVAREAKVKVAKQQLFGDGLGGTGTPADSYPNLLITNTQTIVEGLGGQFTPFQPRS